VLKLENRRGKKLVEEEKEERIRKNIGERKRKEKLKEKEENN